VAQVFENPAESLTMKQILSVQNAQQHLSIETLAD
jgi:hypothetical protein